MAAYVETLPDSGTRSSSRRQSTQSSYSYTQEQQVTGPAPPEAYIPRAGSDILEETPPFPEPLLPLNSSQPAIDPLSQQVVIPKLRRTSRHTSLSSKDVLPASHLSDAPVDRRASSTRRRAGTINLEEVLSLFVKSRSEAKDARQHLKATLEKLEDARRRADKAERLAGELAARVGEVAGDRTTALRDASKAREELGMYKMQYSRAQHELERGNQLLQDSEARRNEAEEEAARARETARNIRTMLLVERAKEEGRLEGFNQGMRARERVDYDGYGDYSDGLDERDRQRAREAINDIVSVVDERHDNKSVQRPFPSPAVQQTPEQPPPRPPPPAEPQFPSGASPTSQPSIIIPLSQESFFTPTPARRAPETRRPNSISTDTTTTLPAAPSNFAPPTSGAPKMPTIPETISRRTSVQSSVPHVINTEPEPARRESVRRSQPPSAGGTPRAQSGELPQPVTYAVPPPGTVDRTPNSFVVPPPASSTGRPPSRSSIRGVGSPSMTTAELQRLVAQQSQQGFFDDRRGLASELRGPPAAPPVPRQAPRSGPPPRWVPDRLTMPPQLAPTGPPSPSNFRPPLPTAPPLHAIPPHMVPATTNPPDFRPSSRASSRGHTRTQSMSSPSRPPLDMPHNAAPVRPSPRPLHRRSTSTGAPDIDISVQSPSDPDFSYTRQHGDTPDVRAPPGRDYLSPHSAPFSLPSVAAPVAPPSVPSPTSTNRDTPRSFSNPLPQQYLPRVHAEQSPQDTRPPQPFHPHNFAPPRDTRNSQTFVPRVAVSQSSRDSQPQYFMPSRTYGDVPSRPRSSQGMAPGHASAIPSHIYAAPPTRPRSSQGMAPQRTPPAFVPSLAPSSSSGIPSPQASPRVGGRTPIYAGQQPVPIPPRNGSPAPLMVPSPQARTARLSNAGATPRAMNGHLPPRSPTGSVSNLPAPRSPTGSVSNLPARAPSPLRGEQGSLFTRWDSHSVEDMGDMAALAMATSSTTRPAPAEATVGRKGGSRRR